MHPRDRVEIARAAYPRAVALVRARSTAASWRRALTASRNLAEALHDRDRAGGERARTVKAAGRTAAPERATPRHRPDERARERRPAPAPRAPAARGVWAEVVAEWERAKALMTESCRLIQQAKALRAEVASFLASRPLVAGSSI